jgi:cell division protein ZapA
VALVEALVNKKLAEAALTVKSGESQVAVILAMMNLAEACLEAQTRFEEECRASQVRLSELIERLSRQAL